MPVRIVQSLNRGDFVIARARFSVTVRPSRDASFEGTGFASLPRDSFAFSSSRPGEPESLATARPVAANSAPIGEFPSWLERPGTSRLLRRVESPHEFAVFSPASASGWTARQRACHLGCG